MKLIFCKRCETVIRLHDFPQTCICRSVSAGYYNDNWNAWYHEKHPFVAVPIGISNPSFNWAKERRKELDNREKFPDPDGGEMKGGEFEAWVFSTSHPRFVKLGREPDSREGVK